MTATAAFADYAVELLSAAGRVASRRMFGGFGLYCDGVMFALIADDVLYLKADALNRPELERASSAPFIYGANGRRAIMSYWRAPDDAMESREAMAPWARSALAAALRARAAHVKTKSPVPKTKAPRSKSKSPRRKTKAARPRTKARGSRARSKR